MRAVKRPSALEFQDYRAFLQESLAVARSNNGAYSLRAFAKLLGLSPSTLSAILSGTKGLSSVRALELADRMKLSPRETDHFYKLARLREAKTDGQRAAIRSQLLQSSSSHPVRNVTTVDFKFLNRWNVMALLEICGLRPLAPSEFSTVARSLRMTVSDLKVTLKRLCALGFVALDSERAYSRTGHEVRIDSDVPSDEIRKYHRAFAIRGHEALDESPIPERFFASDMLTISAADVPVLRKRIAGFLDELHAYCAGLTNEDRVYGLSLGFFEIARNAR